MTFIYAIFLLGILIFVHELGHFLLAKLMGVKVERFSLGFGPKVVGLRFGETEYQISAVPLGGYVKMLGETPVEAIEGEITEEPVSEEDMARAFNRQPVWKRFFIVLAGPLFNVIFAGFLFVGIMMAGVPELEPVIGEVMADTPAMAAGLMKGDRIVGIEGQDIARWDEMTGIIHNSAGEEMLFKVRRGDDVTEMRITPEMKTVKNLFGEDRQIGLIGIRPSGDFIVTKFGLADAVVQGAYKTYEVCGLTVLSFIKLIQRVIPADNLGGPILIVTMAGEQAEQGARSFFTFMAFISINLGIINLFPVPVLDGGHIMFMAIESIRGKPISEKTMIMAQKVGLALILTLIAFAVYNDIVRFVTGRGLQ